MDFLFLARPGVGCGGLEAWRPHPVSLGDGDRRSTAGRWEPAGSGGFSRTRGRSSAYPLNPNSPHALVWNLSPKTCRGRALRGQAQRLDPGRAWEGERRWGGVGSPAWPRGRGVCVGESVPPKLLPVSLSPLLSFLSLPLPLPRIRRPSPGFLSPDPELGPRGPGSSPRGARLRGLQRLQRAQVGVRVGRGEGGPRGKARRERGRGGPGPEPGNREPGAHPSPRPRPGGRGASGKCAQSSAGGRRWGHGDARTPGAVPGGVTGRAGVEAALPVATDTSGLRAARATQRAAVPMLAPTVLGTHALGYSAPGSAPAP